MILVKSVQDKDGAFVGLHQFREYFARRRCARSIWNTLWVATVVTAITIPLAFRLRVCADALLHAAARRSFA